LCVLVVPILFIGNPKQGKSASGDEGCTSNSNNNTYSEGEGGNNNSTCSEGGGSNICSEGGRGSNSNTSHKGWGCRKETKGEATKVENECWLPWIAQWWPLEIFWCKGTFVMPSLPRWLSCQIISAEEVESNNDHHQKATTWFRKELECWCCPSVH